jgi:predicted RNA binding protein YcfA (HicA-like mRNA interferase family)
MSNFKTYTGKKVISILKKLGFAVIRIKGSHHYLQHEDGRATVVPVHSNEDIGIGLLLKILKDVEITKDEFENILK